MKKRILLLDADMTLFNFEMAERRAIAQVCTQCGIEPTHERLAAYHEINDALWKQLERGEVTQAQLRILRFERFLKLVGSEVPAQRMAELFVGALSEGCYLFPQALSLMQALRKRGCRVALFTNGIPEVQHRRIELSGLSRYVERVIVSGEVGYSKPDARLAIAALELMRCDNPAEAAIVGDSLSSDMLCARNAQLDGIWYNPAGLPRPADNPYIVAEIRQLHDLIRYV